MSDVNVTNNCQAATWVIEGATFEPCTTMNFKVADNSLPINLKAGDPTGSYHYIVDDANGIAKLSITLSNNQFTIPFSTFTGGSLSMSGPINVSIGDGQG